ncbi:hypothetical protein ACQZ6A_06620 [Agrobacterium vitis]
MAKYFCRDCDEPIDIPDGVDIADGDSVRRLYRMIAAGEDRLSILRKFYTLFSESEYAPPLHLPETELRLADAYAKETAHG